MYDLQPPLKSKLCKRIHRCVLHWKTTELCHQDTIWQSIFEKEPLPLFESTEEIVDYIDHHPILYERTLAADLQMCLLNVEPFDDGWYLNLIDKDAHVEYTVIKEHLSYLPFDKQKKFFFRLIVWRHDEDQLKISMPDPGSILHIKNVFHLQIHEGVLQGEIHFLKFCARLQELA